MSHPPIVAVDTETTARHHKRQVWEIGMVRRSVSGEKALSLFVADVNLEDAEPEALDIGGYWKRHPQGRFHTGIGIIAPNPVDTWKSDLERPVDIAHRDAPLVTADVAALIVSRWTHGAHIVGGVPAFDMEPLAAMMRDAFPAIQHKWHYHLVDTGPLAYGYLNGLSEPGRREVTIYKGGGTFDLASLPWKSDALARAIGVEPPPDHLRHTALADARFALAIFDRVTGDRYAEGGPAWEETP